MELFSFQDQHTAWVVAETETFTQSLNTSPTDKQSTFTITSSYHNYKDFFHCSQNNMAVAVNQR